jgi:hypothetical protein
MVSHPDIQTAPTTTRPLVTRPAPHSDVDMRPASPRGGVFLPPPTSFGAQSHSQSPARGAMTLPPLSTISPLVHSGPAIRPQPYPSSSPRSSVPLANLIHPPPPPAVKMEEREREYKAESSTPRWYRLPERELSPRSRKRQSMEAPAPRYRFDTIDEHAVLQERPSSQPRHSMPASYGGHGQSSQSYVPLLYFSSGRVVEADSTVVKCPRQLPRPHPHSPRLPYITPLRHPIPVHLQDHGHPTPIRPAADQAPCPHPTLAELGFQLETFLLGINRPGAQIRGRRIMPDGRTP